MSHEESEYEPLDYTWRVIYGSGAELRTGPLASDQVAGPPLCYGTVVHPAGKPRWMKMDDFFGQPPHIWAKCSGFSGCLFGWASTKMRCSLHWPQSEVAVAMRHEFSKSMKKSSNET